MSFNRNKLRSVFELIHNQHMLIKRRQLFLLFNHTIEIKQDRFNVWIMVFNVTFNNISVISWRSVLFVEETGVHSENHRPVASH